MWGDVPTTIELEKDGRQPVQNNKPGPGRSKWP